MRVCRRTECRGCTPALRSGDATAAQAWAAVAVSLDAGALRQQVAGLPDAISLVQLDAAGLEARVAAALVAGELRVCGGAARRELLPLAKRQVAAAAPAPAPSAPPRPAAATPPPPPSQTTPGPNVDVAAMVAVLQQAARDGTPFCEECAREAEEAGP